MGFFANRKSVKSWKSGKRHAYNGNFDKALVYFDDAARIATDKKIIYENRLWHDLVSTIIHSKSEELEDAKDSYTKFTNNLQSFKTECMNAPGVGSIARYNTSCDSISAFVKRYDKYISQARPDVGVSSQPSP